MEFAMKYAWVTLISRFSRFTILIRFLVTLSFGYVIIMLGKTCSKQFTTYYFCVIFIGTFLHLRDFTLYILKLLNKQKNDKIYIFHTIC